MIRWIAGLIGIVAVGGGGFFAWDWAATSASAGSATPSVATERVTRGPMSLDVYLEGELRAAKMSAVPAPSVGGTLRILSMLETGAEVVAGDVVMEFDPAEQQYALEQAHSEVEESEQEIRKRQADVAVQLAQDKVTLLTAQFDVRRAELDAAVDPELMAANEIKIRQLSLEEVRRRLTQVEADVKARETTAKSGLAVLNERRAKSGMNADRAKLNMENLVLKSPIDGLVVVRENRDASGGFFFGGMSLPDWRTGDNAFAGRPMFDVFDTSGMEIRASVNEQERSNLSVGQAAMVQLKTSGGAPRSAKITTVGSLGRVAAGPLRMFDVVLTLDALVPDAAVRPGTTVAIVVTGKRLDDVLSIPKHALFEKDGKSQVYVRAGDGFEMKAVKVLHRSESRVAIEGVDEGVEIALIDPTRASAGAPASAPGSAVTPAAAPAAAPGGVR